MITTRYIDVAFGGARSAMARALYQYDYGQILRITDLTLPFAYEVHFADTKTGNSVTMIGNADGVEIPDACLLTSGNVYCWFYLHDTESDGETRYEVLIPILARAKPTNASPTPVQQDVIDQAIAALDAAVQQTGEDVIAAGASASAAAGSASDAEAWAVGERDGEPVESTDPTYHNNSKYYAGEAASAAQTASQDAQTASDAAIAAGNAKTAAETAQGKAETAQEKAEAAQTAAEDAAAQTALDVIAAADSADEASGYANTASGYASTASGYATAAQGHAQDASGYASSASGYATNAYNSAQAAAGSAGEASGYATTASGYATDANNAKIAAQGAQTAAETAQGLAEAAQTGAEAAQTAAETARDAAVAATEDKAPVILDSASGAIVSIIDGAGGMNARSLVVGMEPIQAGSGDPSPDNIRPISGRTGVTVTRTGKNLLEPSNVKNLYVGGATGLFIGNDGVLVCFRAKKGVTYTISGTRGNRNGLYKTTLMPNEITSGKSMDSALVGSYPPVTFTADEDVTYAYYPNDSWDESIAESYWIEIGSTASAYEAYNGTAYPVTWQTEAGTVYGGTVDVVSGLLTVTHGTATYVGAEDESWSLSQNGDLYRAQIRPSGIFNILGTTLPTVLANIGKPEADAAVGNIMQYQNRVWYYPPTSVTTVAELKTWLASNNLQIVFRLATPQTYQLTPTQVQMLLGANNVWSTGDTVSLTYPCDTKLYIERLTAPTEDDMVANANIQSGKYFMIGNSLYYSTQAIAQGAAIVVGTNCNRVGLADALNALA